MNIKQVINKLTDKWPAKLICLILAILLYILHQTTLIEKKTIVIPLTVIQEGNCTYVGNIAKNVTVVIRASQEDINTIQASDIQATVNLNPYANTGLCDVPVNITVSEHLMSLDPLEIKVKPEKISVNIEERVLKYVEVKPSIVEKVAYGYKIESVICNPPYVEIIGPKSIVEGINEVYTKRLPVSNAINSFTADTSYYEMNKLIDVPFKEPYKVTVAIVPEITEKAYSDLPVAIINLPEGFEVDANLPKVSVKVEGTVLFLENYEIPENAIYVNLRDVEEEGSYELSLQVRLPGSITLKEQSLETVTVNIIKAIIPETEETEENLEKQEEVSE